MKKQDDNMTIKFPKFSNRQYADLCLSKIKQNIKAIYENSGLMFLDDNGDWNETPDVISYISIEMTKRLHNLIGNKLFLFFHDDDMFYQAPHVKTVEGENLVWKIFFKDKIIFRNDKLDCSEL